MIITIAARVSLLLTTKLQEMMHIVVTKRQQKKTVFENTIMQWAHVFQHTHLHDNALNY